MLIAARAEFQGSRCGRVSAAPSVEIIKRNEYKLTMIQLLSSLGSINPIQINSHSSLKHTSLEYTSLKHTSLKHTSLNHTPLINTSLKQKCRTLRTSPRASPTPLRKSP